MGTRIDNYSYEEGLNKVREFVEQNIPAQIVTINPEMYAQKEKDEYFKQILSEAEMIIPDGIGIKIALKLKGKNISRLPGIDFAKNILKLSVCNNYPVAIIGSKEEVIEKAVQNLRNEIPNINIVYYHNGYFNNNNDIYEELKKTSPKIILVALGSPKQEYFIYEAKKILSPAVMIGIGGSLDVWSGTVKRAPVLYQKLGLEWLYRTINQPERFKRIFPALPLFFIKVLKYKKEN